LTGEGPVDTLRPVRERPEGIDEHQILAAVGELWDLDIRQLSYVPEGGGSYHWQGSGGGDWFVTVDDLTTKPWLGADQDSAFEGLRVAFDTARRLQRAGWSFVVAPLVSRDGSTLERVSNRYGVSVYPFVDGRPGTFEQPWRDSERTQLIEVLAQLHGSTPVVADLTRRRELVIPAREGLLAALSDLSRPWSAGPFAEPARRALAARADTVRDRLAAFDELAGELTGPGRAWVVTHGEPHGGNTIRTSTGLALIDWDTVALAPAERDLWMLDDQPHALDHYTELTGVTPSRTGLDLYRLAWTLTDLAAYVVDLRAPHQDNADTRRALTSFTSSLG